MAGPAGPDRPPVSVWEYLDYLKDHPEMSLDQLAAVRFPIDLYEEERTVTSLASFIALTENAPGPAATIEEVIHLYRLRHEAGTLSWNEAEQCIEVLKLPVDVEKTFYRHWWDEVMAARQATKPDLGELS
jgi:hypothetical protein